MPDNAVIIFGGRDQIRVAIAIHVAHIHGDGPVETGDHLARGKGGNGRAVIGKPAQRAVVARGHHHIGVAVPIQVGHGRRDGVVEARSQRAWYEAGRRLTVILEPDDLPRAKRLRRDRGSRAGLGR